MKIQLTVIKKQYFLCLVMLLLFAFALQGLAETPIQAIDVPFEIDVFQVPQFFDRQVNILDFDAVPGGKVLNTIAINSAIKACAEQGGGTVVIPRGIWLTGPIHLLSNINLHVEDGALVLFSPEFEDYPLLERPYQGGRIIRCTSPIMAVDLENIAITGQGVFDGNGQAWRPVKKMKMTENRWNELLESGGALEPSGEQWWPTKAARDGRNIVRKLAADPNSPLEAFAEAKQYLRPVMVSFINCKNLLLDGPVFQNSPGWNIHPMVCENITIRNITVRNPWFSQNGDGLDLESCKNVYLYNSSFDVGDDAICLKSGKDKAGRERGIASEKMIITNCIVYHGHGGFTIGSEMSGGVKDIYISDCTFIGTDVGLRFKSTRGRGGVVENIWCKNIDMINIPTDAIRFNMYYNNNAPKDITGGNEGAPAVPVSEETPQFRNIWLSDVTCRGAGRAVLLQGLPEMPIRGIHLDNVNISADKGLMCVDADGIQLKNVCIEPVTGPALTIANSINVSIDSPKVVNNDNVFIKLVGNKTKDIEILNSELEKNQIVFENGARPTAILKR